MGKATLQQTQQSPEGTLSCRDELLEQMEAQRAAKRRTLEERGGDDVFATAHTDTLGSVVQKPPDDYVQEVGTVSTTYSTLPCMFMAQRLAAWRLRYRHVCTCITASFMQGQGRDALWCQQGYVIRMSK